MIILNIKKLSKIIINSILLSLVIGCNISNTNTIHLYQTELKVESKNEAKILNFESKVIKKSLEKSSKIPTGKEIKLNLDILSGGTDKIKIPENGEFSLVFESNSSYKITDNDATDGEAKIQLPSDVLETYINTSYQENNQNSKLDFEDKLYYLKDTLTKSDDIYRIGKRLFPIPDSWHSDDGKKYILRFKNNGIKKADLRFYQSDKVDYPSGIAEIDKSGGTVELAGVSKLEIPEGAITDKTVIVVKQELQGKDPLTPFPPSHSEKRESYLDYISPLIRIEPMGLKLNKKATLYFNQVDLKRLGNNNPCVIEFDFSREQNIWYGFPMESDLPIEKWIPDLPGKINEFGYVAKFMLKWISPTSNIQGENANSYSKKDTEDINIKFDMQGFPDTTEQEKIIKNELNDRAIEAYKMFSSTGYKLKKCNTDKNGYIINLTNDPNILPANVSARTSEFFDTDNNVCSRIVINKTHYPNRTTLEHELWHSFQYSDPEVEKYMENDNYLWIKEGTADYMGSKAYEQYKRNHVISGNEATEYIGSLNYGVYKLDNTVINRVNLINGFSKYIGYDTWGFFNTISRLEKEEDKSIMLAFKDIYGSPHSSTINPDSIYLSHYHDYAVNSFIAYSKNYGEGLNKSSKLFVYSPTQLVNIDAEETIDTSKVITTQKIGDFSKNENPVKITSDKYGQLNNFSVKYFRIQAGADLREVELHFDVKNLSKEVKITPISFSKNNQFVYIPKKNKATGDYQAYTSSFLLSDGSNNKLSFGKEISYVVLAVSYSDKLSRLDSKANYEISVGYGCPIPIDDKDSNKNVEIYSYNSNCFKNINLFQYHRQFGNIH